MTDSIVRRETGAGILEGFREVYQEPIKGKNVVITNDSYVPASRKELEIVARYISAIHEISPASPITPETARIELHLACLNVRNQEITSRGYDAQHWQRLAEVVKGIEHYQAEAA